MKERRRTNGRGSRSAWVFVLALGLTVCLGVGLIYLARDLVELGESRNFNDFSNNEQRLAFVRAHLPAQLKLPKNAQVQKLRYDKWMDWSLRATIQLTAAEHAKFAAACKTHLQATEHAETFQFQREDLAAQGTVQLLTNGNLVRLTCFTT